MDLEETFGAATTNTNFHQKDIEPFYENGIWKGRTDEMLEGYYKLGERIFNQFKDNPDFVGQIYGPTGEENTFKRMGERSIKCALWLKKQGICQGDIVGLCSKNQLDCWIPLIASLYIGSICSPLLYRYLDEEFSRCYIETRKPKVLFVDEDNAECIVDTVAKIGYSMPVVVLGEKTGLLSFDEILADQTDDEVENFKCKEVNAKDPAIIINTSGTTSVPKGVLHSYGSFSHMLNYYENDGLPSTVIGFYGINVISGIRIIIRSIIFKATLIITPNPGREEIYPLIEKYKVTQLWFMVYSALRLMKTRDLLKYDLSSVELVTYGGGIADKECVEFFHQQFKNAQVFPRYGSTESGTSLTGKLDPTKITSAGRVMANVEMKIVDPETNKTLGANEEGEIYCRTPKIMTCYWNNTKATEEPVDSEGWYHMGDLGYYDTEGYFFILERINDRISIMQSRRPPSSVFVKIIKDVPGVAEVAVVPQPSSNPDYYEVPMAFITTTPGMRVTEDDINTAVEKKLPDIYKLRGGICFLDELPYTCSGKINNRKLRAIAKASVEKSD